MEAHRSIAWLDGESLEDKNGNNVPAPIIILIPPSDSKPRLDKSWASSSTCSTLITTSSYEKPYSTSPMPATRKASSPSLPIPLPTPHHSLSQSPKPNLTELPRPHRRELGRGHNQIGTPKQKILSKLLNRAPKILGGAYQLDW